MQFPDILVLILSLMMVYFGYKAIVNKHAKTDFEFDDAYGSKATSLGWLWVALA